MTEKSIRKIEPTSCVYNKEQMLGKGSFGEVFLGFDQEKKNPVAVKVVSFERISSKMNSEEAVKKLTGEVVNMQLAKHQRLVSLHQVQKSTRNLYLICEYCNGQSFDKYLKSKRHLTEPEALSFFNEILDGFRHLYLKKIVHRDLKPANLLMHNYSLKIADLGFSKALDQHEQLIESIVGTPLYMSPQILSQEKYTQKTDIWSLGVILYEMLYGRPPWKPKSIIDLKEKIDKQNIEFPEYPLISPQTKNLLVKMLQVHEKQRINWEVLFERFDSFNNTQTRMVNEEMEFFREPGSYFQKSRFIESEMQLYQILNVLKVKSKQQLDMYDRFKSAEQFFAHVRFLNLNKLKVKSYCNYYLSRRNRISYLFKICVLLCELEGQGCHFGNLYASMLLTTKFCISSLHKMLEKHIDDKEEKQVFPIIEKASVKQVDFIQFLLEKDLETLQAFYQPFIDYYDSKLQLLEAKDAQSAKEIHSNLSGLYTKQNGDHRFIKFMLKNYLKQLFNQLKALEQPNEDVFFVSKLIFQFQKNFNLFNLDFENGLAEGKIVGEDLNKKYEEWRTDSRWAQKLPKLQDMQIDSISTFFTKEFKWNPLHRYLPESI